MHSLVLGARRRLARFIRGGPRPYDELTMGQRRQMWPAALPLTERQLRNCRVLENRTQLLNFLPKNAVCAELGIYLCDFSSEIRERTEPKSLHLIDINPKATNIARSRFSNDPRITIHLGDSSSVLWTMPENTFDWIYIDGDHSYEGARKDLLASHAKLKPNGIIVLNDYVFFGVSDFVKYGVVEAVNEFCVEHDYEWLFFALQGRMYCDVALRKIAS